VYRSGSLSELGLLDRGKQPLTRRHLVLYTDGVTEAFNDHGEEFGEQRVVESLRRHRDLRPQRLLDSILNDVKQFSPHEQYDDITLMIARCEEH
jgi:serine phosphatase RsbU (regulator of sigma subunit)